jgi:CheY-like chemotaxis protein
MTDQAAYGVVVLFVDDDPMILRAIQRLFHGHPVITTILASTADAAIEAIRSGQKIDVIVSDLRMPGIDGLELLRHARARYPEIARILMSGWVDKQALMGAHGRAAVDAILAKPFDNHRLEMTILELGIGRAATLSE